jgi:serine/threonine protein kinase
LVAIFLLTNNFFLRSDIWAIGVITYFLLCGYTPFDRDSNLEEMQAILAADYSFTPLEYWRGVSAEARNFINRCLTIDPARRMTAHEALQHPWISPPYDTSRKGSGEDLLPTVKKNFNARRTLHRAIDTVRAINKLREGGGFMMDGVMSIDPKPERVNGNEVVEEQHQQTPTANDGSSPMQIDSRGNARGQTEDQIREQERRVKEMVAGLWSRGHGK